MGWGNILRGVGRLSRELERTQRRVDSSLKVFNESMELCRSSKNPETRISRMTVAIHRLGHLCNEHPGWPDVNKWQAQKKQLEQGHSDFVMANLEELIDEGIAKIDSLKSESARQNRAKKLVEKLYGYKQHPLCERRWMAAQILHIKQAYNVTGENSEQQSPLPDTSDWSEEPSSQSTDHVSDPPSFRPVSFLGKLGIWFCWAAALSPISQKGEHYAGIGLLASIALTIVTIKWINRRRERKANTP